jgi:hypothetical protein
MAWLPNPIACDMCGAVKQPSNNWYYAAFVPQTEDDAHLTIWPWDYPAEDRSKPYKHICGQVCAIRLLNEFMNGLNPPEQVPAAKPDPPGPHSDWERVKKSVRESLADAALKSTLAALPTE